MIGNNELRLNKAEMHKAIEYYLNAVVFKEPCKVTNVIATQSSDYTFLVSLMPPKEVTTGEILEREIVNKVEIAIEKGAK